MKYRYVLDTDNRVASFPFHTFLVFKVGQPLQHFLRLIRRLRRQGGWLFCAIDIVVAQQLRIDDNEGDVFYSKRVVVLPEDTAVAVYIGAVNIVISGSVVKRRLEPFQNAFGFIPRLWVF